MDWLTEAEWFDGTRFGSLAEAWDSVAEYAQSLSPEADAQERSTMLTVFYAGADVALAQMVNCASYAQFERRMERRWQDFVQANVLPYVHLRSLPVSARDHRVVDREIAGMLRYQRGYWDAGRNAACLCRHSGVGYAALKAEVAARIAEVMARHRRRMTH